MWKYRDKQGARCVMTKVEMGDVPLQVKQYQRPPTNRLEEARKRQRGIPVRDTEGVCPADTLISDSSCQEL